MERLRPRVPARAHDDDLRGRLEPQLRREEVRPAEDRPHAGGLPREPADQRVVVEPVLVVPREMMELLQDDARDAVARWARGVLDRLPLDEERRSDARRTRIVHHVEEAPAPLIPKKRKGEPEEQLRAG